MLVGPRHGFHSATTAKIASLVGTVFVFTLLCGYIALGGLPRGVTKWGPSGFGLQLNRWKVDWAGAIVGIVTDGISVLGRGNCKCVVHRGPEKRVHAVEDCN